MRTIEWKFSLLLMIKKPSTPAGGIVTSFTFIAKIVVMNIVITVAVGAAIT